MLPFIRRMDAAGLSAMNDMRLNLSAPAVTALYLLTRGPIYDMYMLKLACMGAFLLMAVLAAHAADRRGWGLRGEALLLLCLILPQGFLTAGSAPQIDALGALLLVAALTLLDEKRPLGGMLLYGAAFALSGAALYALPLVALLGRRGGAKGRHAALAALVALAACLPAVLCGVPAGRAAGSLVHRECRRAGICGGRSEPDERVPARGHGGNAGIRADSRIPGDRRGDKRAGGLHAGAF